MLALIYAQCFGILIICSKLCRHNPHGPNYMAWIWPSHRSIKLPSTSQIDLTICTTIMQWGLLEAWHGVQWLVSCFSLSFPLSLALAPCTERRVVFFSFCSFSCLWVQGRLSCTPAHYRNLADAAHFWMLQINTVYFRLVVQKRYKMEVVIVCTSNYCCIHPVVTYGVPCVKKLEFLDI